jgi:putative ABC transport system permease protein
MGTNVLTVRAGAVTRGGVRTSMDRRLLTMRDVENLRALPGIAAVSPVTRAGVRAVGGGNNYQTSAMGVTNDFLAIRDWELDYGTLFSDQDMRGAGKVAIIGQTIANELYPGRRGRDAVGEWIRIGNMPVRVIGLLKERGQNMGEDQDDVILLPVTTVLQRLSGTRFLNQIMISTESMDIIPEVQEHVLEVLRATHGLSPSDDRALNVRSQAEMMERATETSRTMTALLAAIAGVSLVVGGIGIMNIMLVSVTERTREIGIRMAVGARERDILMQFLIESILLIVMGGVIGVALSVALIYIMNDLVGIAAVFAPATVLMSLGFSGFVGVFFGFYPARKAARLNPIQALRFE